VVAAGIALSAAWRAWNWHRIGHGPGALGRQFTIWNRIYLGSDTRADALLVGCLTALLLFWFLPRPDARTRVSLGLAAAVALVAAGLIVSHAVIIESGWLPNWGFLVFAVCVAVVIAALVAAPGGPLASVFGLAPLAWLGRRSYAIYLFHQIVYRYCKRSRVRLSPPLSFAFQMLMILVVAELSYRLVEAPMLRRKRRFDTGAAEQQHAP
jgi:peptidoglycan/LPS O-acetylase OafA/YrhL